MQSALMRMVTKINEASIDPDPDHNIFVEDLMEPELYSEILARLPADDRYEFIKHPDAVAPDGRVTRKILDLTHDTIKRFNPDDQAFWANMNSLFSSDILMKVIIQKFYKRIKARFPDKLPEMLMVPVFYRDFPGYRITEHTDAPYKIATMGLYLPKDESQIHLGTSFHQRVNNRFELLKTNKFKPNSAFAFVRTDNSWHSVKELGPNESIRNSLALTIYVKGQEFKTKNYE